MKNFVQKIGQRIDQILDSGPRKKIVFVHIPKCGGNSILSAINEIYGPWSKLRGKSVTGINHAASKKAAEFLGEPLYPFRIKLLAYTLSKSDNRYITGHIAVNEGLLKEYSKEWSFVTILRDPVDRWFSEYFYNRYKSSNHMKINLSLEEYLSSSIGKENGCKYVTCLSGQTSTSGDAITQAKKNLSKFSVYGILENLSDFKTVFHDAIGRELKIPHKNKNPSPSNERNKISPEIRQRVIQICQPDIEIYEWAKKQLSKKGEVLG